MDERRIADLREELLRLGLAPRRVRRALGEIRAHHRDLFDAALTRGASEAEAHVEATELLGSNAALVERYAALPELRAWSRRWPALCFTLLPLLSYVVLCAATLCLMAMVVAGLSDTLHHAELAHATTRGIDLSAQVLLLGVYPWLVATGFGLLAYRRQVSFKWLAVAICVVSVLAALFNVSVVLTGATSPTQDLGQYGAGIGISPESLPQQLARAVVVAGLALGAVWLMARRSSRGQAIKD
jgi:HAMP domain-containing protein